jgi:hypothetical protein
LRRPGSIACGRSGLPLLAICPNRHRRTVPVRLLKTSSTIGRRSKADRSSNRACGSAEVTLFGIESQAELEEVPYAACDLAARQDKLAPLWRAFERW